MKKILLVIMCIFLTGCTVEYNITIDTNTVNELSQIKTTVDELSDVGYNELNKDVQKSYHNEYKYYNVKTSTRNNIITSQFQYDHKFKEYPFSRAIEMCYEEEIIKETDSKIIINTPKRVNCLIDNVEPNNPIDKLTINITTDLQVEKHNADKKKGNTYTWIVDKTNYNNKSIHIEIRKTQNHNNLLKNNLELIVVFSVFLVPLAIIIIYVRIRKKRNNKI